MTISQQGVDLNKLPRYTLNIAIVNTSVPNRNYPTIFKEQIPTMIIRKIVSVILTITFLFAYSSCTTESKQDNSEHEEGYVIDASGLRHKIPDKEEVTIASAYAVAVPFIVALELSDNTLAINYKSLFWEENVEGLAKAGSIGRGVVDMELLAKYAPDVVIHRSNDPNTVTAIDEKLGIPVISIQVETVHEIIATLDLLGRYCHKEQRAQEVKEYMTEKFIMIEELASQIPEANRCSALVFGSKIGVVAGGDMLQSWMLELAGGISLASGVEEYFTGDTPSAWANIGTETIFEMNPDVIFCTSSSVLNYTIDQLIEDPSWSSLEAIKTKRIYQIPANWDSWDLPGIGCVIGTMWMLYKLYPELITAEQLQTEIDEYYMFMFNKTFDKDYLGYEL
ncbi:MAG: ABC transporter substrate-binding protein [Oscillospiraceae bacterium]|nr:ABC transporter substrate-binding protein [Oscillospiraceae bacterium]